MAVLVKYDGDEYRNRGGRRDDDFAGRRWPIPSGPPSEHFFGASIGVWLFYVQHQFEDTFWSPDEGWNFHEAALRGSSHYDLPQVLRWFTANIGIHHVHNLYSRIPYYRLSRVLRDHPEIAAIGRLTFLESLRCARIALWDEERRRGISFRDMDALARQELAARPA